MHKLILITAMASLSLASLSLAGSATAAGVAAQAAPAAPANTAYDRAPWWMKESVITQTGMVYAEVPANRASFNATFLSVDESADKAQAKAINQTRALNQALDKLGKDAVRVTTGFSMRALYEQYKDKDGNKIENQRGDKINGYQVSLNLSLEVRDMSVLEKAYALVMAAAPTSTGNIYFSLQPTNEQNTWMYTEAVKDAHTRAAQAADAAGGKLGAIKVIDPTGRACQTDILARAAPESYSNEQATEVVVTGNRKDYKEYAAPPAMMAPPPPPAPVPPVAGTAEYLEARALANPFIQTPPLQRLDAKACVVYGLN